MQLIVQLDASGFHARRSSVWIAAAARDRFLAALRELAQARSGEACLDAMSPHDLTLRVVVYDRAGHVAIRGHVGGTIVERDSVDIARVPLRIEIEPSTLPNFVRDMLGLLGADADNPDTGTELRTDQN